MPDQKEEAQWRAEFERIGETHLRDELNFRSVPFPEPKRQFAFRWLREQEAARAAQNRETLFYVRWTFWAAVAAVAVGMVGVFVTLFVH